MSCQIYKLILKYYFQKKLDCLWKLLKNTAKNLLNHIKYNPEKYFRFLIKIKQFNSNDCGMVTIFPSKKININNAIFRKNATNIYYWLNIIFNEHKEIYTIDVYDQNSEFSCEFNFEDTKSTV